MKFWLGTHEVSWLGRTDVPLFISRRRLARQKTWARAGCVHQVARGRVDVEHRQRLLRRLPVFARHLAVGRRARLSALGVAGGADVSRVAAVESVGRQLVAVGNRRDVRVALMPGGS